MGKSPACRAELRMQNQAREIPEQNTQWAEQTPAEKREQIPPQSALPAARRKMRIPVPDLAALEKLRYPIRGQIIRAWMQRVWKTIRPELRRRIFRHWLWMQSPKQFLPGGACIR